MPCYSPLQAFYRVSESGKKKIDFSSLQTDTAGRLFRAGHKQLSDRVVQIPCGKCIGCRLEKSRQWAVRCMHEASLYEDNCFITLTYSDEHLPFDGSLDKRHLQLFMKRLRRAVPRKIRYFACGEYGDQLQRPHYHICLFNYDFPDKQCFKINNGNKLYESRFLESIWGNGFCILGSLTFDSAAYVARYCMKKIDGVLAEEHYGGRRPEFACMSLKPGIGFGWYEKYRDDCWPSDYLIVNGHRVKVPRYYENKLKEEDPVLLESLKERRRHEAASDKDSSFYRLKAREICTSSKFKRLVRKYEVGV